MTLFRIFLIFLFVNCLNAQLILNEEEKEWISKNPIVKVGVDSNWPPFDFVDSYKKHQGISSEYLNLIASSTGLNFEIYSDKWNKVMNKIKKNKLDILACADSTDTRREYLNFTSSYLDVDIVVVGKKDLDLESFNDIQKYKIALPKDNFVHEKLKKRFPKMKFIFVKSNEEALKYVSYGKAEIYIGNLPVITYLINNNLLTNLEVKLKADFKQANLSIGVVKEKEVLLSILNKALDNITKNERQKIANKWILDSSTIIPKQDLKINLTKQEKDWLSSHGKIKISGDTFWPPYSFLDKDGKYVGMVPDLVSIITKKINLDIEYKNKENWADTIAAMKNKELDMIDAISYSKSRAEFMNFSTKYFAAEIVIIANKNNDKYVNSLMSIKNKKIATVKGYSVIERILNDYPSFPKLVEIESPLEGLKELSNSQIDYFILDIPSFEYYSKAYSLSNLKIVGPTGYTYEYGFGILKEHKELTSIINKLLKNISVDKKDEIYRKWIKVDYEQKIDYDLIWKIVLVAFFILFGTLYWNRKLQSEIEEKEEAQKKLSDSRDFVSAIMNSQMDIIVVTDGKEIKQVNQSFLNFLKIKNLSEFKKNHKCICDLFDTSDEKNFLIPVRNDETWIDEVLSDSLKVHKAKIVMNDEEYIFKVVASKIKNSSVLKTAVFHDITEVENLHKDLVKAKDIALSAAKHKSEFLANMSHEIRTPMNSVIGFTELLDKEIDNPVQKDYLQSIKRGGNALLGIINDILDLSKIEAGKLDIKKESINPKNLIGEVESIFHSKIISKNITFTIEIDENIPDFIIIDSIRIRQVLFNLIGNAIKFTEKGTIKLKVENLYKDEIKSKIDLIISVEDTGIGIDKKDLKNVFKSFEQSDQDDAKYGGTGLGLAICSKLVSMMNGEIEVESKKGVGSIFRFRLYDIPVSSLGEQITAKKLDFSNIEFEKATILVVDDIEENRKLVQASLKNFNFKIIMAENGELALDRLKNIKIDLILMDLRMPVMDGYQTATIIKNDEKLKNIPLIALTASVMGKDLEKVGEYGFDGYLRKPVILDDLIEEISKYLKFTFLNNITVEKQTNISTIDKSKLDEVLGVLTTTLKEKWNEVKDKGDFLLIDSFVEELDDIAPEGIEILSDYISQLKNNIDAFDIEKVDYLMNSYEKIIEELIKMRRKLDNE
ncbi:transporter substrate-binding domain-containing protein [Arcobacter sp. LA11]|uniref:transporter substrate-binding domain-containing protein n=1 Tax=Arcobacter sp. LA11 TaxID=1898176 RepID=UPI000932FF78|nr:transporter substrate-binding domain-containing protein [Arcobacter sp. LA11]